EATRVDGPGDGGAGLVHEDAHANDARRRHPGELARRFERDPPGRARREHEADVRRPQRARKLDVLGPRQPADLDVRHATPSAERPSSRSTSSGSSDRSRDSPTRKAEKPAAARRSTSARVRIPLSATRTGPSGIERARSWTDSRSVENVSRLRALMPM